MFWAYFRRARAVGSILSNIRSKHVGAFDNLQGRMRHMVESERGVIWVCSRSKKTGEAEKNARKPILGKSLKTQKLKQRSGANNHACAIFHLSSSQRPKAPAQQISLDLCCLLEWQTPFAFLQVSVSVGFIPQSSKPNRRTPYIFSSSLLCVFFVSLHFNQLTLQNVAIRNHSFPSSRKKRTNGFWLFP